jgi:enterochelin esterase-like enzyme
MATKPTRNALGQSEAAEQHRHSTWYKNRRSRHSQPVGDFSTLLLQKNIPHEYRERPGGDEWREWDHQIEDVLKVLVEFWHLDTFGEFDQR